MSTEDGKKRLKARQRKNWKGRTEIAKQKDEEKELSQCETLHANKLQGVVQQAESSMTAKKSPMPRSGLQHGRHLI